MIRVGQVAAGYFDCCRDFIDAPNGTIFSSLTCQDPVEGSSSSAILHAIGSWIAVKISIAFVQVKLL